jgi:hypothetical protein
MGVVEGLSAGDDVEVGQGALGVECAGGDEGLGA